MSPNDPNVLCGSLSGGNLQRLILSRELDSLSTVLVAVNPAAGLDLAMAQRVCQEIRNAASKGKADRLYGKIFWLSLFWIISSGIIGKMIDELPPQPMFLLTFRTVQMFTADCLDSLGKSL